MTGPFQFVECDGFSRRCLCDFSAHDLLGLMI
jgi:hypothetical protein